MSAPETPEPVNTADLAAELDALPQEDRWDRVVREAGRVWAEADSVWTARHVRLRAALQSGDDEATAECRADLELATSLRDSLQVALGAAQSERDAHLSRRTAEAADAHSRRLIFATWVLAAATAVLALATIGLIWATLAA